MESVLVRWQYSGLCSTDAALPNREGFVALPGFPGVLVGVQDDALGTVVDVRPLAPRPSRTFLLSLPSAQLVELWRVALTNQRRSLALLEVRHGLHVTAVDSRQHNGRRCESQCASVPRVSTQGDDAPLLRPLKEELR